MIPISYSEILKSKRYKYLLQTSTNGFSNKIVSTIFREGTVVASKNMNHRTGLPEVELQKVTEQFHQQQKAELELLFNLAQKFDGNTNQKIIELIGKVFLRKNFINEAIHLFERFLEEHDQEHSIFFYLGEAHFRNKDFQSAGEAFLKAVSLKPEFADYQNRLGLAYLGQGACKQAMNAFNQAIEINVYYAAAYFHCGLTYIKNAIVRDDYELSIDLEAKATHALEYASQLNPAYKRAEYIEGLAALKNKNYEEALGKFQMAETAIELPDPRQLVESFYLKLISNKEQIDVVFIWDYIKELNLLMKKYPSYADLYNDLGIAYCILGAHFQKEAANYFDKALQRNSEYFKARKNKKLVANENRGLEYLIDTLLNLDYDQSSTKRKALTIQFF